MSHEYDNEKWEKRTNRWNKVPNQERIKTLAEKENYFYLEIMEVNIIKKANIEEKK